MRPHAERAAAAVKGLTRYFTGRACKHGHVVERFTVNGLCVACVRLRQLNPDVAERNRFYAKRWAAENRQVAESRIAQWRAANPDRVARYIKKWRSSNKEYGAHRVAWRRAWLKRATPKWADPLAIAVFYRSCPKGFHVDHIVPLSSAIVCGLHTRENLQYLPAAENIRKNNRFDPGH